MTSPSPKPVATEAAAPSPKPKMTLGPLRPFDPRKPPPARRSQGRPGAIEAQLAWADSIGLCRPSKSLEEH